MHRLRTVYSLDVSAVAGHHAMPAALLLFCKAQLVRTNFLYPYQMLSFYEIKSYEVSVPKCPSKWLYFINQGQLFQISYINMG